MPYIGRLPFKVVKAMYHPEMPKKIYILFFLPFRKPTRNSNSQLSCLYQGVTDAVTAIVNVQLWVWHICWMISRTPVQQQEKCVQRARWVKQAGRARAMQPLSPPIRVKETSKRGSQQQRHEHSLDRRWDLDNKCAPQASHLAGQLFRVEAQCPATRTSFNALGFKRILS